VIIVGAGKIGALWIANFGRGQSSFSFDNIIKTLNDNSLKLSILAGKPVSNSLLTTGT
jgi:hypothetical protein